MPVMEVRLMWDDQLDGKVLTLSRPVVTYMLTGSLFFGSRVRLAPQWVEDLEPLEGP